MNRKITLLLTLLFLGCFSNADAQCPSNIDFELGSFAGWNCYTGLFFGGPVSWTLSGPVTGRHTIMSGTGTDAYGFFPVVAPGGGVYSAKLGANVTGNLSEKITYNVTVPTTPGIWSLIYRYAVVLEDPGHPASAQPKMTVAAYDGSTLIPCTSYTYISSPSIPSFSLSPIAGPVYYKPWTYGNMKFPGLGGHTVTIDFEAFDCAYGGHFGYSYVDITCGFFANSIIGCAAGTVVLSGPDGYSSYQWVDSATYSISYGTSQIVSIVAPTVTTTYALLLTPYTGYGCPDTLYTRVVPSTLFLNPSHDTTICNGSSATLTAGATSTALPFTYVWSPATGLSCTSCATPIATPTTTTVYSVTVTDAASCSKSASITVSVIPTPCPIGGPSTVCPLASITETDCATGGVWTCGPLTIGTISPLSGVLTGVSTGTVTVIYTMGGICSITKTVSVNGAPAPIMPPNPHVCVGSTTTLTDATPGGTWSIVPSGTYATIGSSTGVVTGIFPGTTSVVTYTSPSGCTAVSGLTVNVNPAPITGITTACVGSTTTLVSSPGGGTWSISPTTTATVNPTTGVVYGVAVGTATATYTLPTGCYSTAPVFIVPLPSPISGPSNVCLGATGVTYTDVTSGGLWSVSNSSIAYVDPTGVLFTYTTGVDTIYYTSATSGCAASLVITVNPLPVVTGVPQVCVGATTTLTASGTVTWLSSDITKATVGATTGIVTGVGAGTVNITCTTSYGCYTVTPFLVNPLPLPISGPTSLCVGTTITLTDATSGGYFHTSPGTWATVTSSGVVTGIAFGTEIITYTSGTTGCDRTLAVTVNSTPSPITSVGPMSVCVGGSITLSDLVAGGTWSCTPLTIGTINSVTGAFTGLLAGTDTVSYSLGAGCVAKAVVTVNPLPPAITPTAPSVCVGSTTGVTCGGGAGSWSSSCGALTIGAGTGIVTGVSSGTCPVTYTVGTTGCSTTRIVTVNPNPLAITPPSPVVCVGSTLPLGDATGGGTWSSTVPTVGSVAPATGVVTGITAGTTTIKYSLATGCSNSTLLTVSPLPSLFTVTGTGSFCAGTAGIPVGLSGSTVGVSYQLLIGGITIGSPVPGTGGPLSFGNQTTAGTYTVVATNTTTLCSRTMTGSAVLTVNPAPLPIVGASAVCIAGTMTLSDGTPGGIWTSSNPLAATCTPGPSSTTTVTGITNGLSTVITYTLPTTCYTTTTVTVSPSPGPILGVSAVCVGACVTLSDTVVGGLWSSSNPGVATAGTSSGSVCGVTAGAVTITYSLGTGCSRTYPMTVTAAPLPITGIHSMCVGDTATYHDATLGGAWSMDPGSVSLGTIGVGTGHFVGSSVGVATISYAAAGGTGCGVPYTVSINPIPTPIAGSNQVCVGVCTTLSCTPPGGSWSVTPSFYASIGAGTGALCGISPGTSSIVKYTASGCSATMPVTVNPLPSTVSGPSHVCQGSIITLTSSPGTGTWSSSAPAIASVIPGPGASTVVTGGSSSGIATITYTLPTTCARTIPVTVNTTPAPIAGPGNVCQGYSVVLTDPTPGGTWSSSIPSIASVSSTGVVTGVAVGCATITYTVGTCNTTFPFCVVAPPGVISGPIHVCVGATAAFTDPTPGGTWSTNLPAIATISPTTGILTGISSGTVIVSYGAGCYAPAVSIVVNPISPILGNPVVCQYQTTHLMDTTLGGTWSSSNPLIATVNPSTGIVTGVAAGTATINYTISGTTCSTSIVVTVNPAPAAITGSPQVCVGATTSLASSPAGGTWSSSAPAIGSISTAGVVSGLAPGLTYITYTLTGTTGCPISAAVTVNANPSAIAGPSSVCTGSSIILSDGTPGGVWSSSAPTVASVASGVVTGLTPLMSSTISYTIPSTGCSASKVVTVTNTPPAPTGVLSVCEGQTTVLTDAAGSGSWSSASTAVATVNPLTGAVYGASPGTAAITFSLGGGCISLPVIVTVNPLPGPIMPYGPNLCVGSSLTLTDVISGGAWSSSITAFATIDPVTGSALGVAPGSTIITYQLPTGCSTSTSLTVSAGVPPITGSNTVCLGSTTSLYDAAPGGVWSSSLPATASVNPSTGVVSGLAVGTAIISYNTGGFCIPTMTVTVNPLPMPIAGSLNVCQGDSVTLTDGVAGGVWSSGASGIASVGSSSGVVTALVTGSTAVIPVTIAYTLGASCSAVATISVNPLPAPITGANNVCVGQAVPLSDVSAGVWSSGDTTKATTDVYGDVSGVAAGHVNISYTNGYSCYVLQPMTVNPMPSAITGAPNVCLGGTTTLHDALPGGTWSSLTPSIATVGTSSGIVTGLVIDTATILYSDTGNCVVSRTIVVSPLPQVFAVTGGGSRCSADSGVHIGLTNSSLGVNYLVYLGATAVGVVPGTGTALDLGLYTVAGTYTVTGTSTATGCSVLMSGSAVISVTPSVTTSVSINTFPSATVCAGATVTVSAVPVSGGSPTYVWSVNSHPVALTGSYSYIPANNDTVTLSMTSSIACATPVKVTRSVVMTVNPFAMPSLDLTVTPSDTVCKGTTVTVHTVPTFGGTAPYYAWFKNGAPISVTGGTFTFVPNNGDAVYATMSSNYPCRLSNADTSAPVILDVDSAVYPFVSINANPGTSISLGQPDTLTAIVTNAVSPSYQWYVNGIPVPAATTSRFVSSSFSYPKEDSISVTVTNNGVCTMTSHEWVYIRVHPVSVQQVTALTSDITVLPNPNKGEFMIKGSLATNSDEDVGIDITDVLGQVIYRNNVVAKSGKLNEKIKLSSSIANGMYILSLHAASDNRVFHIVIEQ